ncbi:MAG: hypothetical protein A2Z40_05705 [Deltaproteobacteria bacterium RBG_19FT_COMBO_60_16]|nr:MAG: hypothetical protein A2Z40_05705 [Deltaproteobacteria bacterium RBG_19FT_COMBO_60_16]
METEKAKVEKILAELEASPEVRKIREDKAAEVLAKRLEVVGRIEALRNEQAEVLPKLQADLEEKEAAYSTAKAALEGLAHDCRTAALALRSERVTFDNAIRNCEASLFESADPAIDAAILFFRDKLDDLRRPGKIDRRGRSTERNIFTWTKKTTVETNTKAIHDALAYCRAAIMELEKMKLTPELDLAKIEAMKSRIPRIDVFTEYVGDESMERTIADFDSRMALKSDSQIEWEIGKLNDKFKKIMGRPA